MSATSELLIRFLIGGTVVSLFAALGDILRPKSFAGLFGAAPSIALATIGLTISKHGAEYAATESRSMIFGAIGFFFYAWTCSWLLLRREARSPLITIAALPLWFGIALGMWWMWLR